MFVDRNSSIYEFAYLIGSPLKILYKHRTRGQDVESVHILGMSNGFRELGYDVVFCSPPAVQVGSSHKSAKNTVWNLVSIKPPTIIYELMAIAYNFVSWRRSRRLLAQQTFDFVYERYAFFDCSTSFLGSRTDTKLVLEVNGAVNRKDPTHARPLVLKRLAGHMERRMFSIADLIVVVSTSLKHSLIEIGVPSERILVLPNAVNLTDFEPENLGVDARQRHDLRGKRVVGFVGSFTFWHGVRFLIESLEAALRTDPDMHLLLVGDGPEKKATETLIAERDLGSSVTLTGRVPHTEIPSYISAMDVGVMPDSNDFGSPMKIFEYMAMSKPVVSARYQPTAEIIDDGENGFLFEPGDGTKLVSLVTRLLGDADLSRRMGAEGRRRVERQHTWHANTEKVCDKLANPSTEIAPEKEV